MTSDADKKSLIQTGVDILTSPAEAFASISHSPRALFPLGVIILAGIATTSYYFSILDFAWWIDDVLKTSDLSGEELETARDSMQQMGPNSLIMGGLVATVLGTALLLLVQTTYISLAASVMGSEKKFSHWLGLVSWSSLPYVVSSAAMAANITLHPTGQLSARVLDPTSLSALGMGSAGGPYEGLLSSISLPMLWSLALIVIGFAQWQKITTMKSAIVMLTPYALLLAAAVAFS